MSPKVYLVSACLLGLCTRYDAQLKESAECCKALKGHITIPICPEQLGGLPTPRPAADVVGGTGLDVLNGNAKVLTKDGLDLSREFIQGAQQVVKIAQMHNVEAVYLKSRSPSCGVHEKLGVTAALLAQKGYRLQEF